MPSTPLEEIQRRIGTLQTSMAKNGFDGVLIVQRADLFYLTGTGQDAHLFVPVEGPPTLLVRKNLERVVADSPLQLTLPVKNLSQLKKEIESACHGQLKILGMELDVLPVNNYRMYSELFPETEISDISKLIREARMIKSPYELDLIVKAATVNDELYKSLGEILREGMTEMECTALLEARHRKNGHQGFVRVRRFNQEALYGHIVSGSNLAVPSCSVEPTGDPGPTFSLPHGTGFKVIERHQPVHVDYVGIVDGYMVDQARTFFLGKPPEQFLDVHSLALAIQEALIKEGFQGVNAEKLFETAIGIASEAGMEEGFLGYPQPVPFVGHGVGLELDELPVVGRKSPYVLQSGMVITLEPKFFFPGKGMAGIKNSFLVTEEGLKKLTLFDDTVQILSC